MALHELYLNIVNAIMTYWSVTSNTNLEPRAEQTTYPLSKVHTTLKLQAVNFIN
jgi:hypothetical protein